MKQKENKMIISGWIIGNIILIGLYIFHILGIQCEPCISPNNFLLCQTDYMEKFLWIILAFNGLTGLCRIINRKKNNDTPTKAKKIIATLRDSYAF